MTLILSMVNSENAVIVSDRRLVGPNGLQEDESNKAGLLVCRDARFGFAFTGLAECPGFKTNFWLPEALARSAEPNGLMVPIIERFRQRANKTFAGLRDRTCGQERLTVILAGYHYGGETPRPCLWRISNFEFGEGEEGFETDMAQNQFEARCWRDAGESEEPYVMVRASGSKNGIPTESFLDLVLLSRELRPPAALVGKAVAMIRAAAEAPASHGRVVGTHCTTIIVPCDPQKGAEAQYHSASPTPASYGPAYVLALGGKDGVIASAGFKLEQSIKAEKAPVLQIPKTGKNQPCPCGSGRKYKKCHGR